MNVEDMLTSYLYLIDLGGIRVPAEAREVATGLGTGKKRKEGERKEEQKVGGTVWGEHRERGFPWREAGEAGKAGEAGEAGQAKEAVEAGEAEQGITAPGEARGFPCTGL